MTTKSAQTIRTLIVEQAKRAGVGHIGSALSIVDMLAALYATRPLTQEDGADRLVLSKGHAALALYATLHVHEMLSKETLGTYCQNGGSLGVHPSHTLPGVTFSTGSLGQGLSYAVGMALGDKITRTSRHTYALLSDAECDEGSTWEAAMAAGHHKLHNLCMLIDYNRQQAFGYTEDVLRLEPFADKWRAFNWRVAEVDGHDVQAIATAITDASEADRPTAIICHTTCGKGVSYMEGKIKWHYWSMNDEDYEIAVNEVTACR